jgi:hypothetical protein
LDFGFTRRVESRFQSKIERERRDRTSSSSAAGRGTSARRTLTIDDRIYGYAIAGDRLVLRSGQKLFCVAS